MYNIRCSSHERKRANGTPASTSRVESSRTSHGTGEIHITARFDYSRSRSTGTIHLKNQNN